MVFLCSTNHTAFLDNDWFILWKAGARTVRKTQMVLALVAQKNQKFNNFWANLVILDIVVGAAHTKKERQRTIATVECTVYQTLSTLEGVQFCMFVTKVVKLNFTRLRSRTLLYKSDNLQYNTLGQQDDCLISHASHISSFDCPKSTPATHCFIFNISK